MTGRSAKAILKYSGVLLTPLGFMPAADAADMRLPVKAPVAAAVPPMWSGFYVGVNIGIVSDRSRQSAFLPNDPGFNSCWASDCAFTNAQTATGMLGGLQIGYNFQSGPIVYGIEADIAAVSAEETTTGLHNFMNWSSQTGLDALGTVRGRLGYAFDRLLVYGTGGLAYGHWKNSHKSDAPAAYAWSERAGWRTGYAAGGGFEYKFDSRWSAKGEALYYDVGTKDHISRLTPFNVNFGLRDRMTGVLGRLGVNYSFSP